jgi:hypothetical protein
MLDHTGVAVSDGPRARKLYETALAPLGYKVLMHNIEACCHDPE